MLPTPTRTGVLAQKQAVNMRVGRKTPPIKINSSGGLHDFAHHCLCQNKSRVGDRGLSALDDVFSFESFMDWLDHTHYSGPRKRQLIALRRSMPDFPTPSQLREWSHVKSFIKLEGYPTYKPPRGIMSRTDRIKVWIGPLIKRCENLIYDMPEFIKHVPHNQRSQYIRDHIERVGCTYAETDYTSFEGSMRPKIMHVCEFSLLNYLCRRNPRALERMKMFERICTGDNVMNYTDITARIKGRRMSGEMTTSLSNGWTNLMLSTFVLRDVAPNTPIIVEGDDGILALTPDASHVFTPDKFANLGFVIKIIKHDDITEAGFCGIVCDASENSIITNPIEAIASFGWVGGAALRAGSESLWALLRAKALSLAYQYPGCPILSSLAKLGVRLSFNHRRMSPDDNPFLDGWSKDIYRHAEKYVTAELLDKVPGPNTRSMMARKYGISQVDQIRTEKYLDEIKEPTVLSMPWLLSKCTSEMIDSAQYHVRSYAAGTPWHCISRETN